MFKLCDWCLKFFWGVWRILRGTFLSCISRPFTAKSSEEWSACGTSGLSFRFVYMQCAPAVEAHNHVLSRSLKLSNLCSNHQACIQIAVTVLSFWLLCALGYFHRLAIIPPSPTFLLLNLSLVIGLMSRLHYLKVQVGARNVIPFYHPIRIVTSQYRCCKRANECCILWKMRQMSPVCKMADIGRLTVDRKVKFVLFYAETKSVVATQRRFRAHLVQQTIYRLCLGTVFRPMMINSVPDVKCFCKNKNVLCVQSMVWHFVRHPVWVDGVSSCYERECGRNVQRSPSLFRLMVKILSIIIILFVVWWPARSLSIWESKPRTGNGLP